VFQGTLGVELVLKIHLAQLWPVSRAEEQGGSQVHGGRTTDGRGAATAEDVHGVAPHRTAGDGVETVQSAGEDG
jgi:hypothetical protein